jgi:hypothetical protein
LPNLKFQTRAALARLVIIDTAVELLLLAGASPHATGISEGKIFTALQMAKRERSKSKLRLLEAALKAQRPTRTK